uniref:Envelope glycoprotein gp160 n=1 Tax=Simian immunodeficiency virus TaxID=11723 RepID=A0A1Z3GTJ6_SIV|nr:envelope glycoprotein [Simian immunodeficiency virus]ASC61193.1 envelope glycoprotein [Simian immunodeficiency virus]ASC61304.1 envelope glycoprotein [Simian immunodeficiency virus]
MRKLIHIIWGLALLIQFIEKGTNEDYVTVFYGVPVWRNATPTLFCATNASMTSTEVHNVWATTSCVPIDPAPIVVRLNTSVWFNAYKNYMVESMTEDMLQLFQQSHKPCVQLTPMCVRMNCTKYDGTDPTKTPSLTNTTTGPTTTIVKGMQLQQCNFTQKTGFKDKKQNIKAIFYEGDLMECQEANNTGNNSTKGNNNHKCYYLWRCNTTTITHSCEKSTFEPIPIHYCAPAGYAILRCEDEDFTGVGMCKNVSVVHCTHGISPMVATWLLLNGTYQANTSVVMNGRKNESVLVRFGKEFENLKITCIRPGNRTVKNLQIGPGMTYYNVEIATGDTRKAFCRVNATLWKQALNKTKQVLVNHWKKIDNQPNNVTVTAAWTYQTGDPEVTVHWFNCQGEFFYCNISHWFDDNDTKNDTTNNTLIAHCRIKQIVNHWGIVSKGIYLAPRKGNVSCTSSITGIMLEGQIYGQTVNVSPSARVADQWRAELSRYQVVEIDPLSVAPTTGKRPEIQHTRQKRGIGIGLFFLGLLSAAGSTMGAASIALTAQTRNLLHGIVQQQANLLQAIETQQHLLQLSVWGIKQLQARMLAVEKYLRDQQLLSLWGCADKVICHTTVPWNNSWVELNQTCAKNSKDIECIWTNMTWQEWDRLVQNSTGQIYDILQIAHEQQERNKKELYELDKWSSLWNWFDITQWLWYIKIFIMVVGAIIGLRILLVVVSCLKKIRQGYHPLSFQIPTQNQQDPEQPEEIREEGGRKDRIRWRALQHGFFALLWVDLTSIVQWIYQICRTCLLNLWAALQHLCRITFRLCNHLKNNLSTLWTVIRTEIIKNIDRLAIWVGEKTDNILLALQTIVRIIREVPRRIRQGLEIALN